MCTWSTLGPQVLTKSQQKLHFQKVHKKLRHILQYKRFLKINVSNHFFTIGQRMLPKSQQKLLFWKVDKKLSLKHDFEWIWQQLFWSELYLTCGILFWFPKSVSKRFRKIPFPKSFENDLAGFQTEFRFPNYWPILIGNFAFFPARALNGSWGE